MTQWQYKGFTIQQESEERQPGKWASTARLYDNGEISMTALPALNPYYPTQAEAEEATRQMVRKWIDKRVA